MPVELIYEHVAPLGLLLGALALAIGLGAFLFWRYLPLDLTSAGLFLLRVVFLFALLWCMLMPVAKRRVSEVLKPRLLVAVDTSSSMKLSPDPGKIPARWDVAKGVLEQAWPKDLAERCEVEAYAFSKEIGNKIPVEDAAALKPDGTATHLRESLRKITDRYRGQPLVALLLLSDGLDTREARDEWTAEPWPCPIYTVRLEPEGGWETEPDVRVDSVDTPRRVVVGWDTKLSVLVSGQGTKGQALRVLLSKNGEAAQEMPTAIPADGGSREVTFHLENPATGVFTYRVDVPPLPGEKHTNDNSFAVSVQVVDAKNRLLYVEDVPRWESKYFVRVLNENKSITPLSFLRGPGGKFLTFGSRGSMNLDMTPEQLLNYKVIVLGDLDAETLGERRAADLLKFVETGGSLILLGGPKAWGEKGFAATALAKLLPVKRAGFPPVVEGKYPVVVTEEGLTHPAFLSKKNPQDEVLKKMPPVLTIFPGSALAAGASTLVTAQTADGAQPLLVSHRYGQGKVVALLSDSLWRWSLEPGRQNPYAKFWNQLLMWLAPEQQELDRYSVDLFANADKMFLGDPVELNARVSGPEGAAVDSAKVACEILSPDGRKIPFPMSGQTITTTSGKSLPGYAVTFTAEAPGLYKAVATTELDGRKLESAPFSFFIKAFNAESNPRPINADLLRALAASSGGKFLEPAEVARALAAAPVNAAEEERVSYHSLWNQWPVIAVLVFLLGFEWIWRRMKNMA